jgi:spermidine/putrescine transport system permease protein
MDVAASRRGRKAFWAYLVLMLIFLYAPIAVLVVFSLNDNNLPVFPLKGFTTQWYEDFVHNEELTASLLQSAKVAAIASVGSVALGVAASIALVRRRFFGKTGVSALLLSPLVIPYVVFGASLLVLFKKAGVPLSILTLILGHIVVILPYTILTIVPRLERVDVRLEEAAFDLGATGFQVFRKVTLPLIAPAILAALIIAFTTSFDEVQIASFVVGDKVTFPIYLYSQLRFPTLLPQLLAVAVVVLFATIVVFLLVEVGRRALERRLDLPAETGAESA